MAVCMRANDVVTALDLSNNSLSEAAVRDVGAALSVNTTITQLDISKNHVSPANAVRRRRSTSG